MDRKLLKETLAKVDAGDTVTVEYGVQGNRKETFTVLERKVWRGKGGSILLECKEASSGKPAKLGSFNADIIVNVSVNDGPTVGMDTGTQLVQTYKTDKNKSIALKAQFLTLANKMITVEASTVPSLEGTFKVAGVRKTAGRCGPVVLDLVNEATGEKSILSAVKHSGVIDKIIVHQHLDDEDQVLVIED